MPGELPALVRKGKATGESERARHLQKRGLSAAAIREELFGGESTIAEITKGDMSSEHLVRALLGAEI
ncbi:MAG: hypothetical protein NTU41_05995 [Chloroflexi bacterium]|nr:hypothetical protein [Chloroflexota bacterium]